jgi:toxin FitB
VILLDTNVVSQAMKPDGDVRVRAWLSSRIKSDFYICAPVIAELRFGGESLPPGKKRDVLLGACDIIEHEKFAGRILVFDQTAARHFARMRAQRSRSDTPLPVMDGIIAAIAAAHSMTLATRNVKDFVDLGLSLVDPFSA